VAEDAAGAASIRFPGTLSDRAREIIEGSEPPATPRDAATVMLLRSPAGQAAGRSGPAAAAGLEVYMLLRQPTMEFAPGAFVFPGGSVDARDADEEVAWAGPDAASWGRIFEAPPELARALVCVADTTSQDWEADRNALLDRSLSLAELLGRRQLVLRADLLRPWSRWITPAVEPRRYDARFFAAALPPGQRTRDVGGEASAVTWIAPGAAIEAGRRKEIALWPPTAVTLAELAACGDVATALAGPRQVAPRIPEVLIREGATWLTVPGVQEYPL
jgi:hypothetical protein